MVGSISIDAILFDFIILMLILVFFLLLGVPSNGTKPNNLFYQNLIIPSSQSNDNRFSGSQNTQPPPQQSQHISAFGNRNVGGYLQQDMKSSAFSNISSLQDIQFKNSGSLLHGIIINKLVTFLIFV